MSGIYKVMQEFERQRADSRRPDERRITSSCRAHGCPNAASMDGGVCWFHKQALPESWDAITFEIKKTWPRYRNFDVPGAPPPEPSITVREMRETIRKHNERHTKD